MAICKMILHEFAAKMDLEKPKYNTVNLEGPFPGFVSSINFGGVTYTGEARRSKKEAEQRAALKVISSILGNLGLGTMLPEIVKSKVHSFSTLHKQRFPNVPLTGSESGNSTAATETIKEAPPDTDTNDDVDLDANDDPESADQRAPDAQSLPVQPNLEMLYCNKKRKLKEEEKASKKLKTEVPLAGLESGNSTAATETINEAPADRDTNDDVNLDVNNVPDAADQRPPDAQSLPVQPNLEMLYCNKKRKPKKKKKANTKLKTEVPLAALESGNSTAATEIIKEALAYRDTNDDVNLDANDDPDSADQQAPDAQSLQPNLEMLYCNKKRKRKEEKASKKLKTEVVPDLKDAQAVSEDGT